MPRPLLSCTLGNPEMSSTVAMHRGHANAAELKPMLALPLQPAHTERGSGGLPAGRCLSVSEPCPPAPPPYSRHHRANRWFPGVKAVASDTLYHRLQYTNNFPLYTGAGESYGTLSSPSVWAGKAL